MTWNPEQCAVYLGPCTELQSTSGFLALSSLHMCYLLEIGAM